MLYIYESQEDLYIEIQAWRAECALYDACQVFDADGNEIE